MSSLWKCVAIVLSFVKHTIYMYFSQIYGMVYVVDASDHQRISESREVLHEALYDPRLAGKPLLL